LLDSDTGLLSDFRQRQEVFLLLVNTEPSAQLLDLLP
jgi:hypothetical protein